MVSVENRVEALRRRDRRRFVFERRQRRRRAGVVERHTQRLQERNEPHLAGEPVRADRGLARIVADAGRELIGSGVEGFVSRRIAGCLRRRGELNARRRFMNRERRRRGRRAVLDEDAFTGVDEFRHDLDEQRVVHDAVDRNQILNQRRRRGDAGEWNDRAADDLACLREIVRGVIRIGEDRDLEVRSDRERRRIRRAPVPLEIENARDVAAVRARPECGERIGDDIRVRERRGQLRDRNRAGGCRRRERRSAGRRRNLVGLIGGISVEVIDRLSVECESEGE